MSSPGKKLDPTAGRDEEARIKAAAAAKANPPTGAMAELKAYWPVLAVTCTAYVFLQASNTLCAPRSRSDDLWVKLSSVHTS